MHFLQERDYPIMMLWYINYATKSKVAFLIIQNRLPFFLPTFQLYPKNHPIQESLGVILFSPFFLLILLVMGKLWVEVCLISARGLRRSSSLWKLQWFAVGWIDPNNKYCSKIDASGNANPVWRTKFAVCIDVSESNFNDLALHVEVYSREPIFLRERLQGTATILLKEFLAKHDDKNSEVSRPGTDEVGSYQLRKRNSNKPQGFVDVSIRISEDREEPYSYIGGKEGHIKDGNSITLAIGDGSAQAFPTEIPLASFPRPENQARTNSPYTHPMALPTNYSNSSAVRPSYPPETRPSYPPAAGPSYPPAAGPSYPPTAGPSYQPPRTPPPPPPPSNAGYIPTFLPRPDRMQQTYVNMPSSSSGAPPGRGGGPGFAMGMGAGALAAGAVIFGDDFMSGFDVPSGLQDPSIVVSTDPLF
ncbi:protein SRC2 [Cannabis sativa]|uniref:protein SRC2 n=1 Tax=Cannabis sativa TaxID=3483 RepID=UPI0029CA4105|nr:protein SRC2 [Cannabis sativa]